MQSVPGTVSSPTPDEAAKALDAAARAASSTAVRGRRWVAVYLTGWATAGVGLILAVGLGGQAGMMVGLAVAAGLLAVGAAWASRQGSVVSDTRLRIGAGGGAWGAVYGCILAIGLTTAPNQPAFWVPAAIASAVPLLVAAWLPARRSTVSAAK